MEPTAHRQTPQQILAQVPYSTANVAQRFLVVDTNIVADSFDDLLQRAKVICLSEQHTPNLDDGPKWRESNGWLISHLWDGKDCLLVEKDGKESEQIECVSPTIKQCGEILTWDALSTSQENQEWEDVTGKLCGIASLIARAKTNYQGNQKVWVNRAAGQLCELEKELPNPSYNNKQILDPQSDQNSCLLLSKYWLAQYDKFQKLDEQRTNEQFWPRQWSLITLILTRKSTVRKVWVTAGAGHFRPCSPQELESVNKLKSMLEIDETPYLILHPLRELQEVDNQQVEEWLGRRFPEVLDQNDPVEFDQNAPALDLTEVSEQQLEEMLCENEACDTAHVSMLAAQHLFMTWSLSQASAKSH
ncbi:MAG: hypothetical protein AB7F31_05715 [Parachlamydiales bacterium]